MYSIVISQSALKQLQNLQKPFVKKIGKAIEKLANDPRPIGVKKLQVRMRTCTGSEWVITVLYVIDDGIKLIDIRRIGHRKDIYK